MNLITTVLILFQARLLLSQETCTVVKTNSAGTCKTIRDCPGVLSDIRIGRRDYTVCHITNGVVYICCPNPVQISFISRSQQPSATQNTEKTTSPEIQTCKVEKSNSPGTCKRVHKCPAVLEDIKNGKRDYTVCHIIDSLRVYVCCPNEPIVTPTKPEPKPKPISEIKCHEYSDYVFEESKSFPLIAISTRTTVKRDRCGHKKIPLIVGGTEAVPREFPHMALIGYDVRGEKKYACGGTLISERYVMTAAHCTISQEHGLPKYVRLGELDVSITEDDADPEDFDISQIILHPTYTRTTIYNDIALLKLDRDAILNPYRRPACLPTTFDSNSKRVIATGWGATTWRGSGSESLLKVILEKFNHTRCNVVHKRFGNDKLPNGIDDNTQICAGSWDEKKDTCQGDSGGPIQIYRGDEYCMYEIVGITSFGIECGVKGFPGVYTRVFPYIDWIERTVWNKTD